MQRPYRRNTLCTRMAGALPLSVAPQLRARRSLAAPLRSIRLLAAQLLVVCVPAMLAPPDAWAAPSAIYVVRHAEKQAAGDDPALTSQGQARARNLAAMLRKAGIVAVFSTDTRRTMQTAGAVAQVAGIKVQSYDAAQSSPLVARVDAVSDGAVLVVGHSNTVPELVRQLGGTPGAAMREDEFDRVYQLHAGPDGKMVTVLLSSVTTSR